MLVLKLHTDSLVSGLDLVLDLILNLVGGNGDSTRLWLVGSLAIRRSVLARTSSRFGFAFKLDFVVLFGCIRIRRKMRMSSLCGIRYWLVLAHKIYMSS